MRGYTAYRGQEPGLTLTFQYPAAWRLQEERGKVDKYRQVRVLGPRNADATYTCYVTVRSSPQQSHGGKYERVEELVRNYKDHQFVGSVVEVDRRKTVAGVSAYDLTVSYTVPPQHKPNLKPIPIPVKTRTVFLEKSPYLYELRYSADAREYGQHSQAFERLLKTLRFQ